MKALSVTVVLLLTAWCSSPAHAQEANAGSDASANVTSATQSVAGAVSGGNSVSSSVTFEGSHQARIPLQAPNAVPPSMSASINTCFGGASAGVSFPGGSFGGGVPQTDNGCDLVRSVEAVRRGGDPASQLAARVMMCMNDPRVAEAYQAMGLTCQQLAQTLQNSQSAPASAPAPEVTNSPSTQPASMSLRGHEGPSL